MEMNDEVIIYKSDDGVIRVDVLFSKETVWLTQEQMSILFQRDKSVISRHIKNIFDEGELQEEVVVAKNATTTQHGGIEGKTQSRQTRWRNCSSVINPQFQGISKMYSKPMNCSAIQLLQKMQLLLQSIKHTTSIQLLHFLHKFKRKGIRQVECYNA